MTERLDEKLSIASIALNRLRQGAMRWTPLMKILVKESPSPWKAQVIIKWLLENEYVEKPDRGVYRITDKGRDLLKSV